MISIRSLTKRYAGQLALDNVDLDIASGSIYALIGSNGAGKTTLLRLLLGLIQPTSGTFRLDVSGLEKIGFVSESAELPGRMTVAELLAYLAPFYPTWDPSLAESLRTSLQLPADRRINHLSRGMKMKLQLVAALAFRPALLLMDEPFSGLDALVRDEVVQAMLDLAEHMTVLISSHDLAEIESFASHIGYLADGRLRFSEELPRLQQRFREVEVTLPEPAELSGLPSSALAAAVAGPVLRYIDEAYDPAQTHATLAARYPTARQIDIHPLPLRSIFVALARQDRRPS